MSDRMVGRRIGPWSNVTLTALAGRIDPSRTHDVYVTSPDDKRAPYTRNEELRSFLLLTVVMAPALTGVIIVGYGFLVWIFQMLSGPPTGG